MIFPCTDPYTDNILVPRLRFPRNPEGVANQEGYLRCSKRFDHIGVTLQVLALFEFKSVDERP